MRFDLQTQALVGEHGSLAVADNDELVRKLAMLIEGECEGLGPTRAAQKYGYSQQRYFQLAALYRTEGSTALVSKPSSRLTLGNMLTVTYARPWCTRTPLGWLIEWATTVVFSIWLPRIRRRRSRPWFRWPSGPLPVGQFWLSQTYRSPSGPKAMPMG